MKEKFKNIVKLIKDNKVKSIVISTLLLILISGISYAIFLVSAESGDKKVISGVLDIAYVDGETINATGALPLNENEIDEFSSKTKFTVKNTGNIPVYLEVSLTDITIDDDLKVNDFKYALYKESEQIATGTFENCGTELVLGENILQFVDDNVVEYTIALWIQDNGGDQNSMLNSNFSAKIQVEAIGTNTLLPPEYQRVEYIESTGTQYIDTGYVNSSDNNPYKIEIDFKLESLSNDGFVFGTARNTGNQYSFIFGYNLSDNAWIFSRLGSSGSGIRFGTPDTSRHTIKYVFNEGLYFDGVLESTTVEQASTSISSNKNIGLFARIRGTTPNAYSNIRMYSCKFYESENILVRDFVPCYRKSDNVAGLYDVVNNEFYTNSGTGNFVVGADIFYW